MKITQIRNATIIVEFDNNKFLIDPWLAPKDYMDGFEAGINPRIRQPRVELPLEIEKITNVDAVILTHYHPDHIDEFAIDALDKNIKFFVQSQDDLSIIKSYGFQNIEIITEKGINYKNIKLYKTNCQHGKREIIKPICEKVGMPYDSMGIVFKSDKEKTLYIAGDTIWCDEVKNAINKHAPKIIVINACGATIFNGEHIIMNIDDIKKLIEYYPNSTIIASHMDTVSHLSVTRKDLQEFKIKNNADNLLIPDDGESMTF